MAIAFDATSKGSITAGNSSVNISHTCSATGERLLVVAVTQQNDASADRITGVTYNSVAMSLIGVETDGDNNSTYMFYLINPTTGTNNITVSRSGTTNTAWINNSSYTGVAQSSQPNAWVKNKRVGAGDLVFSLTSTVASCWAVLAMMDADGNALSTPSGMTLRGDQTNFARSYDSNGSIGGAGVYSITANKPSGSAPFAGIMAAFAPPAAGPANLKTYNTNPKANIKSIDTNLIANVKSLNTNV